MTAPHATCAVCCKALYPFLARRTDDGWAHVSCPCVMCGQPTSAAGRLTCSRTCNARRSAAIRRQEQAARAEDVAFMAATGESLSGAAQRLAVTREALWQWLRRQGMRDVLEQLASRDPWRLDNRQPGEAA